MWRNVITRVKGREGGRAVKEPEKKEGGNEERLKRWPNRRFDILIYPSRRRRSSPLWLPDDVPARLGPDSLLRRSNATDSSERIRGCIRAWGDVVHPRRMEISLRYFDFNFTSPLPPSPPSSCNNFARTRNIISLLRNDSKRLSSSTEFRETKFSFFSFKIFKITFALYKFSDLSRLEARGEVGQLR